MASKETAFIAVNPALSKQVEELLVKNRSELIKATVKDSGAQKELLAIADSIAKLKIRDPNLVAAWGLGCGNSCVVGPGDVIGRPLGIRTK